MDKHAVRNLLADRLAAVEARLAAACRRSGRNRADVTLVAVTKTVSSDVAAALLELGVHDLGENRPQELWRKAAALPTDARWHLIGHLQRNKVAATVPLVTMIHSVDSARLLEALDHAAASTGRTLDVLLEIHNGIEEAKQGFVAAELADVAPVLARLRHTRVVGLMTMAPLCEPESCRPVFSGLRRLGEQLRARLPAPHEPRHLSMGMSNDFEVAVEEGATLVRLGSVLFEGISQ